MEINEFFINEYLTVGKTYDNFIFENCPQFVLKLASERLAVGNDKVKPCLVYLDRNKEAWLGEILDKCANEFQMKILARDFVMANVMGELALKLEDGETFNLANEIISAFKEGDFERVKALHLEAFMPYEVKKMVRGLDKIELTFILQGTINKYMQQAINIFISSREPYSVKIFTDNEKLSTYYDTDGNVIECPHDFMRRDVNKFISQEGEQV